MVHDNLKAKLQLCSPRVDARVVVDLARRCERRWARVLGRQLPLHRAEEDRQEVGVVRRLPQDALPRPQALDAGLQREGHQLPVAVDVPRGQAPVTWNDNYPIIFIRNMFPLYKLPLADVSPARADILWQMLPSSEMRSVTLRDIPPTLLSGIQSLATVAGQAVVPEPPAAMVLSVWKEFVSVDAW